MARHPLGLSGKLHAEVTKRQAKEAQQVYARVVDSKTDEAVVRRLLEDIDTRIKRGRSRVTRAEIAQYQEQCRQLEIDMRVLYEHIGESLTPHYRELLTSLVARESDLNDIFIVTSHQSISRAFCAATEKKEYALAEKLANVYLPSS